MILRNLTPTEVPETSSPGIPAAVPEGRLHRPAAVAATCAALAVLLSGSVLLAISLGPAPVPPADTARFLWAALTGGEVAAVDITTYQIIWEIRTPRVLLAALVGAGLSAVGVAVQVMVRNALADPFVLGVSSGAAVGAVGVTVSGGLAGLGLHAVSGGAFAGALFASFLVYFASSRGGALSPLRLVLTGVCVSFGLQAVMSVIIYLAPTSEATSTVLYWTMGSFGAASWSVLPVVTATVLLGIAVLHRRSRSLDVMALGDETAVSLGISPDRQRRSLLVLASLLTGVMVAVSGAISFVGLVMPHLVRLLTGAGHARVLALAPLAGAVFMVWADLIARTLAAPRELPIGVITALVGVPVFITLMRRKSYLFGGR
ncbi:sugar ABC transporter substrate-binding protein [Streptomyces camponoticapitis]|uniref:Sugar ABC transporter substrate-binding protein n=1 Tax=Streptomyces camponoticapitis TaxID=1616125 RepID=A0ABQ2EV59_9ACTN|nr:sugar ABC transporter substrate-binding protein [Streptomyces camponoticapitis]